MQIANVTAFLAGGLAATHPEMKGEPYRDAGGKAYSALIREPVFVYGGTVEELRRTHLRALSRELVPAVYIEAMFKTANDADNRAASPPHRPMRWISSASACMARARPSTR